MAKTKHLKIPDGSQYPLAHDDRDGPPDAVRHKQHCVNRFGAVCVIEKPFDPVTMSSLVTEIREHQHVR